MALLPCVVLNLTLTHLMAIALFSATEKKQPLKFYSTIKQDVGFVINDFQEGSLNNGPGVYQVLSVLIQSS